MKNILLVILAICVMLFMISEKGYAFRCGNEIITRGDSSFDLLNKCGEPGQRGTALERVNNQLIVVDKWFYNCGPQDFIYVLFISNSKVVKEDVFKRGFGYSQCRGVNR